MKPFFDDLIVSFSSLYASPIFFLIEDAEVLEIVMEEQFHDSKLFGPI